LLSLLSIRMKGGDLTWNFCFNVLKKLQAQFWVWFQHIPGKRNFKKKSKKFDNSKKKQKRKYNKIHTKNQIIQH
ncbi:hypothetical protein NPX96_33980, partial [Bacillus cereus]|uniref:hypothetical protein n=1 Tax=Bacillus cereus TaxID=1396 RepID=UPI002112DD21|nr:hypothetical protein [Bacillus cereus]